MFRRAVGVLVMLLLSAGSLLAQESQQLFRFQSNFWVNLHDALLHFSGTLKACTNSDCADNQWFDLPTPATRKDETEWTTAIHRYYRYVGTRNPLFDDVLINFSNVLTDIPDLETLGTIHGPEDLLTAMRQAAPVYRNFLWEPRDRRNKQWISSLEPQLDRYGVELRRQLAQAYGMPWPNGPVQVDVVGYGGRNGAYTTLDPVHSIISSDQNDGADAIEIVFHEASHALAEKESRALREAFRAVHKPPPDTLWHVLLFYTTGEIVRRTIPGHEPYAERHDLYATVPGWQHMYDVVKQDWQPYLDGKTSFDAAITKIAADF